MRILIFFICIIIPGISAIAQGRINLILKDSTALKIELSEIDSMNFVINSDSLKLVFKDSLAAGGKDTVDLKKVKRIEFTDSAQMAFHFIDTIIYRNIADIDSMVFVVPEIKQDDAIKIGSLFWNTKNLDVGRYRNGDPIPEITEPSVWDTISTGAWCHYVNTTVNGTVYGKLYNWKAVTDPRGLAPTGWRIPTEGEWKAMTAYLGGDSIAGGKLKAPGITYWQIPNTGADNSSGFNALPGGYRNFDGVFNLKGTFAAWWTSTEYDANFSFTFYVTYDSALVSRFVSNKKNGMSVRCVKE